MIKLSRRDCEKHQCATNQTCTVASVVYEERGQVNEAKVLLLWTTAIAVQSCSNFYRLKAIKNMLQLLAPFKEFQGI